MRVIFLGFCNREFKIGIRFEIVEKRIEKRIIRLRFHTQNLWV